MSINTTLTLTPNQKVLVMMADAFSRNLATREKTREAYEQTVQGLRDVNQAQAERIQVLEAALAQSEKARKQEAAIANGKLAAAEAQHSVAVKAAQLKHDSAMKATTTRYVTAMKVDAGRIAELAHRIDEQVKEINTLK